MNNFSIEEILEGRLPFWNSLDAEDKSLILSGTVKEHFDKGDIINRNFEGCRGTMMLLSGQIRVYIVSEEGREVTLYRLRAGENCVLSAACLLESIVFDVIIQSVEGSEMLVIPTSVLNRIIEKNPAVELFLAKTANERFSEVMWTMQQILFMGADRRVAAFLWEELKKSNGDGTNVLAYTHDEIAKYIGSAREVVTRILKYFADEEAVTLRRGKIEITDIEKLKKYL
ncbi:MAG: Crp/Fnr family transcriptional regulator [Hornefia sp.]|nr:Crp/Fnr family transcriptional regulator [Hornefia sp.]